MFKSIKYKKTFISGFIFKSFEVILELFLPILMAILMDESLKNKNIKIGIYMVIAILIVSILGYLTTLYAQYAAAKVGQGFSYELRKEVFNHVTDLDLADVEDFSSSRFVNTMNLDINNLQQSLAMTIRQASRAPVLMIGSIVALWFLSPKISFVLIVGIPFLIGILVFVMYYSVIIFKSFQKKNDHLVDIVKDNVEGIRMIKSFSQTTHEQKRFAKYNRGLENILLKLGRITSVSGPLTMLWLNLLLIIMIYFGAINIGNSLMSDSELLQIINYTTMLTTSIVMVMNLILIYTKAFTSNKRIKEFLDKEKSINNKDELLTLDNSPFKIEFKNVSFGYNNSGLILDDISFVLEKGETLGIVGLTGSGKSTIALLLLRFYNVTSGQILINDCLIEDYSIESLRENIAYQQQKPALLFGNIGDNIKMGNCYSNDRIISAINNSSANFILNEKDGVNSIVNRNGSNYSGGQRQRIALARTLAKDSNLLILDDTFSALDYLTDYNIRKKISENNKGQTKIFISQRLSSIYHADKIIVLNNKKIEGFGTHEELLKNNLLYLKIYESQIYGGN